MSCADIIVNLPRPSPDQEVSPDLSPTSYIHHPAMLDIIRRNAGIQIGPNMHKRCYLDPASIAADQTIAQYYDRIHESVSKETISVRVPGKGLLKLLNDGEECKKAYAAVREELKSTTSELRGKIEKLEAQIAFLRKEPKAQMEERDAQMEARDAQIAFLHKERKELKAQMEKLEAQMEDRDAQIAFLHKARKALKAEIAFLHEARKELKAEIAFLHEAMVKQDNARFKMFHANILVDFVKKVLNDLGLKSPSGLEDPKTETTKTRYAQAAQSLSQRQLEAFFKEKGKQLGPQYYKVLQNMSQYIDERNRTAHETHIEFAQLLHSDRYREKKDYWKWANLFPYLYNKTVEDFVMEDDAAQKKIAEEEVWEPA